MAALESGPHLAAPVALSRGGHILKGNKNYRWARRTGFILGLALSLVLVVAWQVPAGTGRLGLDVRVVAHKTGELHVTRTGAFVTGTGLEAGGQSARGKTTITNQTGATLDVRMRLLPASRDLDRLLMIDAQAGGRPLFAGVLGTLRSWTRESVRLEAGGSFELDLRLQLPDGAGEGYRGRIEDIVLELRSKPVGGDRGH
jgi:hypothetical protein